VQSPSETIETFVALAARIRSLPARLGPVRLVAVDGGAGAGKTTFGRRLSARLSAQMIHVDDLLSGWTDLDGFWPRLEEWVLEPLQRGRTGRYRRFDWDAGEFAEWHDVPVADVLIVEGVSSARAAGRPLLSYSVWVDVPADLRLQRGLLRDGDAMAEHWRRWMIDEAAHFAADRTSELVDLIVDGAPQVEHDPETSYVRLRRAR
jgi:uridine kinase